MKKRLIVSALVLAAIVIAPKIVAIKLEESLHKSIAEINTVPGYSVHVKEFKSGWFASTGKIQIEVDLTALSPQTNPKDYSFPTDGAILVDFNSSHGPVLFGAHSGIAWLGYTLSYSGEGIRDTLSWADSIALYNLTGNLGLFGGSQFTDSIAAFKTTWDEEYSIDFSGYEGRGKFTGGENSYSGKANSIEMNGIDGKLIINGINYDMSIQGSLLDAIQGMAFDSEFNFGLNNITLEENDAEQFLAIKELTVGAVTSIDKAKNVASGVINYAIKTIELMDYTTSDIALQMEINNLSLEFLESYRIFALEISNFKPEEINQKAFEFMHDKLLPALTASPELNITDFHGTIPEGNFKASFFTKLTGIDKMPDNIMDPTFWLQHVLANGDIELDKDVALMLTQQQLRSQLMQNPQVAEMTQEELDQIVVQQTPIMLSAFQEQGLVIETESGYIASFELKDGKALLNGNPIPIPGM